MAAQTTTTAPTPTNLNRGGPGVSQWLVPCGLLAAATCVLGWTTVVRNRDFHSAAAIWADAVEKRPDNWRAHYNYGRELSFAGKHEAALAEYRRALELRPDYVPAINNLGSELARGSQTGDRPHPGPLPEGEGANAGSDGDLNAAIAAFRKALRLQPDYAEAHFNLGVALAKQGDQSGAEQEYRAAIQAEPSYADALNNLGQLLAQQGKLADATEQFGRAVAANPDLARAQANLAGALAAGGKLDDALAHCHRALEVEPDLAEGHYWLGMIHGMNGQAAEAVAEFERAIALSPTYADAHFNLGLILEQQGDSRAAIEHFRAAAQNQPRQPLFLKRLAWTLATSSDAMVRDGGSAIAIARQAVELTGGTDPDALGALAAAKAEAGDCPAAVQIAEHARDLAAAQHSAAMVAALEQQIARYEKGFPNHD